MRHHRSCASTPRRYSGGVLTFSIRAIHAVYLIMTLGLVALLPTYAWSLTRVCGSDPIANTTNVLCTEPSGPCTLTSVTLGASVDVVNAGCDFDVGGRNVSIQKTLQMIGSGFITIRHAGSITLTSTGNLKARAPRNQTVSVTRAAHSFEEIASARGASMARGYGNTSTDAPGESARSHCGSERRAPRTNLSLHRDRQP